MRAEPPDRCRRPGKRSADAVDRRLRQRGARQPAVELYSDYRGNSRAWWEALEDPNWRGGVEHRPGAGARALTVVRLHRHDGASQPGEAELWVNRQFALRFPTGQFKTHAALAARSLCAGVQCRASRRNFLSGYFRLLVPAGADHARAAGRAAGGTSSAGSPFSFFQIKGRDDTVEVEHVTLDGLVTGPPPAGAATPNPAGRERAARCRAAGRHFRG